MVSRSIAQQDRLALAAQQRTGDGARFIRDRPWNRRFDALLRGNRGGDTCQRLHPNGCIGQ
ncbi:MAG: hypothetical protein BWZ07_02900 [Alphaproteobacteria bacterium ADurb.BinA280]|nr:MAG: hypothetical protein BWZ07_02900 [Alphaproteobacteria bacterium ADurb.BinA280]